jgi:flagellar hook-basal body complex protein FliE
MMLDSINVAPLSQKRLDGVGVLPGASAVRSRTVEAPATEFSAVLSEAVASVSERLRNAEAVSISGLKGNASTQAVVEQVMAAEQTLQAAIAVRDKIVSAYLEISRMAI